METLAQLGFGFMVAFEPWNIFYCFVGVLVGTLIGVLPGLGPTATLAMLLPVTYGLPAESALIMLAGIYYGSQYGGSTTAILVNLPGESSSVITCLDGYAMARQGRAGPALAIAAIGSLFAGTVATFILGVAAQPISRVVQSFGAAEYFSLMVLGLATAVVLASGSVFKAVMMVVLGLFLGTVGADATTGVSRYTFGILELYDGIDFIPLAMGLFGISEVLRSLEAVEKRSVLNAKITGLMPTRADMKASFPAIVRGTTLGSILGMLPGGGAALSSFAAYSLEKKLSKQPQRFGQGAIEGVAAPEAANNAGAQMAFVPLLTMALPSNSVMALMMGALLIQGIQPGPNIITEQPVLFWELVASMWIGNLMLVVINLPLVGIWVWLLRVPYRLLFSIILVVCCIGVYSVNNSSFEVLLTALFGLLGYMFIKLGCEPAPLLLGFILGPMMEEYLRRALLLSRGSFMTFIDRPLSAVLLVLAVMLLVATVLPTIRAKREKVFTEEQ